MTRPLFPALGFLQVYLVLDVIGADITLEATRLDGFVL